jgi:transmembrane sensor
MKKHENFQNSPETAEETAIYWLLRLSEKNCTQEEKRQFKIWLMQNQQVYTEVKAQWQAMEAFKTMRFSEREAALSYRVRKKNLPRYALVATAASVLLALGLTAFEADGWLGSWETYTTEKGVQSSVRLADGSYIELNTDTELKVHFNRWQRQVELVRGEAFFAVTHNFERPFSVKARVGIIQDIGTRFNVFLQPNQVLVAVEEGEVSIKASQQMRLIANQQIAYSNAGEFIRPVKQDIDALTAWRQGQLRFNNRHLDEVLAEVARYHDISIRVADPSLAKLRVTGVFKSNNLQSILNAITATLPVSGRYENANSIVLEKY